MKTRAIGETFTESHLIYEVKEGSNCGKCCMFYRDEQCCVMSDKERENFGWCGASARTDNKDVYFIQIGEEE